MLSFIHSLSATLFYVLGSSFFIAYVFFSLQRGGVLPLWWLSSADLPLIFCALLYGGLSLYRSLRMSKPASYPLIFTIALPLAAIAIFMFVLNFFGSVSS